MEITEHTALSNTMPEQLMNIPSAPEVLYSTGTRLFGLLEQPCLAVVGSRKVSAYGKSITLEIVGELAALGIIIVSGLAIGIDTLAHEAALRAGGRTIAVMPGGLDQIYPRCNRQLALHIVAQGGVLVSEYETGSVPFKVNFIARNRLVAGLSEGILIPEAALKSGSMHTARYALEQGKTVMAVPGPVNSPLSVGTNNLIRQGAAVVTNAKDVLLAMNLEIDTKLPPKTITGSPEEILILRLMSNGITNAAELQSQSKLAAATFNKYLTILELSGRIAPVGANHWIMR